MQNFRRLEVWQAAHQLALAIYRLSARFPADERFGLVSQLRRCAVSVPSNIAEGCGRGSDADFSRFLRIARGSISEMEYQLMLSRDLGFFEEDSYVQIERDTVHVRRLLNGLLRRLDGSSLRRP